MALSLDTYCIVSEFSVPVAAVGIFFLIRHRFRVRKAAVFASMLKQLLKQNRRHHAVKLCFAALSGAELGKLALFMLGRQIPAKTLLEEASEGYRSTVPTRDFADVLQEEVNERAAMIRQAITRGSMIDTIVLGVAATMTGSLWFLGEPVSSCARMLAPVVIVTFVVSLLGALLAMLFLRKDLRGIDLLVAEISPVLCPVEEMSDEDRDAAAEAMRRSL